jgi:hypothetical protein
MELFKERGITMETNLFARKNFMTKVKGRAFAPEGPMVTATTYLQTAKAFALMVVAMELARVVFATAKATLLAKNAKKFDHQLRSQWEMTQLRKKSY